MTRPSTTVLLPIWADPCSLYTVLGSRLTTHSSRLMAKKALINLAHAEQRGAYVTSNRM